MTIARVPNGTPDGGQFAPTFKPETTLTLVPEPESPTYPDAAALAREWPNPRQRMDRLNEGLYDLCSSLRTPGPDRLGAARDAVRSTLEVKGRFDSLPEDDGAALSYVFDALGSDHKVDQALGTVGTLEAYEARTFGDRLAGALHDIEAAERDTRIPEAPADAWPEWLPTEPPVEDALAVTW